MNHCKPFKMFVMLFLFTLPAIIADPSTITDNKDCKEEYDIYTDLLTKEVQDYIDKYSKNLSKLDAKIIVRLCDVYNIDIRLVIAQAHLESDFGVSGVASRTNSVFNVGTFDDGTILYTYSNPNMSIEPYIYLLKRDYLIDGKKEHDLLKENSFVNYKGKRYATLQSYERLLVNIIAKIDSGTNINKYQKRRKNIGLLERELFSFDYGNTGNEFLAME